MVGIDLSLLDRPGGADGGRGSDAGSNADAGGLDPCADMVVVPIAVQTCVDPTEVSRDAYAAFLAARGADTSGQSAACRFNTRFIPEASWPPAPGTGALPVTWVDWCDAAAYCSWRGKRLCGGLGGSSIALVDAEEPTRSEWTAICSADGDRKLPYGNDYLPGRCHDSGNGPAAVGATLGCEGGYPGVFDLSGNVSEWQDACDDAQGASGGNDLCAVMGGAWSSDPRDLECDRAQEARRQSASADRGFRCCATPN